MKGTVVSEMGVGEEEVLNQLVTESRTCFRFLLFFFFFFHGDDQHAQHKHQHKHKESTSRAQAGHTGGTGCKHTNIQWTEEETKGYFRLERYGEGRFTFRRDTDEYEVGVWPTGKRGGALAGSGDQVAVRSWYLPRNS